MYVIAQHSTGSGAVLLFCDLVNYVIISVVPVGVRGALYSGVTCHVGLLCAWLEVALALGV